MDKTYTQKQLDAALEQKRLETLEEAAKVCEDYSETLHQWTDKRKVFAAAIRGLK